MKRYHKLQEFAAHASSVNCLKIGRKSSGVLVTGGEDKKVNVWAIGKSSAILTLTGHQAPIDCVSFDATEEIVVAGATNGTIKMWDLDQAKVTRTLTGHRSNCLCVDFHPYNACLASGSLDTNIKIWDTRRRLCLSTLKGHTKGVTHIKFSPDGKWIVSGSENGEVKLWNIEAGKLYHDFKKHDNAVTGLDFHPKEYILATCSADKTVRLWDIDQLDTIDILGGECHGVRTAMFHPDGQHLLAALQDGLRVWSWEPALQCDNVAVEWSRISDISIVTTNTRLVGCSFNQNMVGVWYIDLNIVNPWCQSQDGNIPLNGYPAPQLIAEAPPPAVVPAAAAPTNPQIPGVMNPLTRALSPIQQTAQPVKRGMTLLSTAGEGGMPGQNVTAPSPVGRNATERHRISDSGITTQADMQRKLTHVNFTRNSDSSIQAGDSPTPLILPKAEPLSSRENFHPISSRVTPDHPPPVVVKRRTASNHVEYTSARDPPSESKPFSQPVPSIRTVTRTPSTMVSRREAAPSPSPQDDDPPPVENIHRRATTSSTTSSQPSTTATSRGVQRSSSGTQRPRASSFPQVEIHVPAGPPPGEVMHVAEPPYALDDPFSVPMPSSRGRITPRNVSPPLREMVVPRPDTSPPSGMNGILGGHPPPSAVLPPTSPVRPLAPVASVPTAPVPTSSPSPEEQTLQLLRSSKDTLLPQWQVRVSNMALIKNFLMRNNISGALSALKRHADVYLMAAILEVLTQHKAAITLDSIVDYVPLLEALLGSSQEHHYKVGMSMLNTILLHFGQYIHDTIAHGGGMRVDLTGEQRREKCMGIRSKLSTLVAKLAAVPRREPDIAQQAADLMMQLEQL